MPQCTIAGDANAQGRCIGRLKSRTSVFLALAGKFLICPFRHFCCRMYGSFSHKTHRKTANASFFETHKTTRALIYSALIRPTVENLIRSTSRTLLVTLEWIASFGAFINSTRRIALRNSRSHFVGLKLVTETV